MPCAKQIAMAITYKVFLDERTPKGNNKFALKLRITYNRKHKVVPINVELKKDEWNDVTQKVKSSHTNAKLITVKINQVITEIQERALKFETTEKVYSVEDLADNDSNKSSEITFHSFATKEIENQTISGRVGNAITYRTATNKLIAYTGRKGLKFEQIDYKLLNGFTNSMLAEEMTMNAIASYMREIRAIYNKAIKEGVVEQKYYPFNKYKIKTTKTISRALTVDGMKKIINYKIEPNTTMWHSRNYFLLSYCLIGMNFTDMFKLTPESIQNNRLIFSRSKTKKIYSIYLQPMAADILQHYYKPENNPDYLLPVLQKGDNPLTVKKKALQAIKTTNEYLAKIAKADECKLKLDVTTYFARYSWANICKGLGYSKDLIAEALGHSYGNSVTGIYLDNYGNEVIDQANERVIAAVFK